MINMYQSNSYNFEWFLNWLRRNLNTPKTVDYNTDAGYIAKNFSRRFYQVSEQDAIEALKCIGFDYIIVEERHIFCLDRTSPAFTAFSECYK